MDLRDPTRNDVLVGTLYQSRNFGILHRPVPKINPRQMYGSLPVDARCLDVTVYCEAYSPDMPCVLLWEFRDASYDTRKHMMFISCYMYDDCISVKSLLGARSVARKTLAVKKRR